LSARISKLPTTPISNNWIKCIFLLDDFAGSGISFVRKEGELWKGKIIKFLTQIREYELPYENINIYIILYISTDEAITYINKQLSIYKKENNLNIDLKLLAVQTIEKTSISDDILAILEKYYRRFSMSNIEDKHFKR
jgi:hypothetical protein